VSASSGVLSGWSELLDSDGDSTKGALCFLEWKKGMIVVEVEQFKNVSQLAFLEAVTAFLSRIFLIAYTLAVNNLGCYSNHLLLLYST
jgi:hypothetical protein